MGVVKLSDYESQRPPRAESQKILGECRDLALHRLLVSFTSMLDRLSNMLLDHADAAAERAEADLYLSARIVVNKERANIVSEFERILRQRVDHGISGKPSGLNFSKIEAETLSLVGEQELERSIVVDNIARQLESLCRDELVALNQRIGFLLGRYEMESADNPLSPVAIIKSFESAVDHIEAAAEVKFTLLKELNQNVIGDIKSIYADLNRHLVHLQVLPLLRPMVRRTHDSGQRTDAAGHSGHHQAGIEQGGGAEPAVQEDIFAVLRQLVERAQGRINSRIADLASTGIAPAPGMQSAGLSQFTGGAALGNAGSTGAGVMDALTRLQRGQPELALGAMADVALPANQANVLRRIAESHLSAQMNPMDAVTLELVAMIFDYMFKDRVLRDGIKALLGRLQIPVLKAAMLDKAFFSKRTHPARMLVDKLAEAGLGWSPGQGTDDPLYKKIESIVQRIQTEFTEQVELFAIELADLEEFLSDEDKQAEARIEESASEVYKRDQAEIARIIAQTEVETRTERSGAPGYLVAFLHAHWVVPMQKAYLAGGEEGEAWKTILGTVDDLLWSVEPKRNPEERRKLVKLLPDLLQRLYANLREVNWTSDEQERFLGQLVESHAAAVKASLIAAAAVATAEKAQAESAATEATTKPTSTTEQAESAKPAEQTAPKRQPDDRFTYLASSLARGAWVEFAQDDGALVCSRLAWISPLRGNYLFTNRQGRKAFTVSREDLAERFREDHARLVEAEPLLDRAITNLMAMLSQPSADVAPA